LKLRQIAPIVSLASLIVIGGGAVEATAVPFEARPPHIRNPNIMMDRTFSGAIDDLYLRAVLADINAGKTVAAKQKLVKFLSADPANVTALEMLGTILLNEEKHEQAENILRRGVALAPRQVSLKVRLGVVLLNRQKFEEAAPHLQYAVEQEPDNLLALTNYGWLLIAINRNRDALAIYERLNTKPYEGSVSKTGVFLGLAVLYQRLQLPKKAIELLKPELTRVTTRHINNRVFLNLVDAYITVHQFDDAEAALGRLTGIMPADHAGPVMARGKLLAARGQTDDAVKTLRDAVKKYPKFLTDIRIELARLYLGRKYYRKSIAAYAAAASSSSGANRLGILTEFASAFAKNDRRADTVPILERFATLDGNSADISLLLSESLSQANRNEEALTLLHRLLKNNPRLAKAHFQRAVILRLQKKTKNAMAAMRLSVTHNPKNAVAWQLLADLSHDVHGDASMIGVLREGLGHNPTNPRLLLGVGSLGYSERQVHVAQEMFTRLIARYPNNTIALSNAALASLDLGEAPDKAQALLNRAVRIAPNVPAIADTWAWMLHKTGKSAEAVRLLLKVAKAIPNDGGVQYHLGVAYIGIDQPGRSRAAFRRALALGVPKHYKDDIVKRLTEKAK
jgi:cellulose synthase operon protein C